MVRDLVRGGVSHEVLARGKRDGTWTPVRRGAVVPGDLAEDVRGRHLDLVDATIPMLADDGWALSHVSAAALLGLPLSGRGLDSVWITRAPGRGQSSHRRPQLVTRVCTIEPDEVIEAQGIRLTSMERTVVDVARQFGFVTGVMCADAALAEGGSRTVLADLVARGAGRPGNKVARAVAAFADGTVESAGESLMRAQLELHGCPRPILQYVVLTEDGRFVARCDFGWPEYGLVGEYDGREKYGALVRPGQTVSEVVMAEKAREARIRDQGLEIIRFTADDLRRPSMAAGRLRRAMFRSSGSDTTEQTATPW